MNKPYAVKVELKDGSTRELQFFASDRKDAIEFAKRQFRISLGRVASARQVRHEAE